MIPLVIVGTGGHGRETLDVVEAVNLEKSTFEMLGFLDDRDDNVPLLKARGAELIGDVDRLAELDAHYVIGVGSGQMRSEIDRRATAWGREPAVLVHPTATIGADVVLDPGVVLAAGARLTTNVRLGRHTQVNINGTVSHDCRLGPYVTVSPGATVSGTVTLGEGVLIGAGATVIQGITIGEWATIGAGACVVRDVEPGVTVVGVPARPR
jgi:sugar O-acyltransferase (sialic acid O-acetyltransferase NeuD family)